MKKYTIKKKRAGQFFKEVGEFLAVSWQHAKKEFTSRCFNDMALDISFKNENEVLIRIDGTGTDKIDLSKPFDTFKDDVFIWTIKKV
jgi:hypothetical protein